MASRLFVGNLSFDVDDAALYELFAAHGQVERAQVVTERDTNRSRGFGFVELAEGQDAQAVIDALDGQEAFGRPLRVNEAQPKGGGFRGRGGDPNSRFIKRFEPRQMPGGYAEPQRRGKGD